MKTTENNNTKLFSLKKLQSKFPVQEISNSKCASDFIRKFYTNDIEIFESSFLLMLNSSNKTIGYAKISQGGISGTVIDVRIVAKYAIESLATGVILAHNHPSGKLRPSNSDKIITEKIKNGLKILDVTLLDHLIITKDGFFSFTDENIL